MVKVGSGKTGRGCGGDQAAVLHAPRREQPSRQFLQYGGTSAHDDDLETVPMIQMHVQGGHNVPEVVMLYLGQPLR